MSEGDHYVGFWPRPSAARVERPVGGQLDGDVTVGFAVGRINATNVLGSYN
jgi:hypothetical protein